MKIITRSILFFLFIINVKGVCSQLSLANPIAFTVPQSPNAASIDKYGDVPATLHTGLISPSISLFNVQMDGVAIPISLTYHNSGLKVAEIPSWVGLGWDVQAGGMISHTVKGLPDDCEVGLLRHYPRVMLSKAQNSQLTQVEKYQYFKDVYEGEIDGEYDEYSFNLLGRAGRFYINKQGICVTQPKSDLRITYTYDSASHLLQNFTIIDEGGNTFYFNDPELSNTSDNGDTQFDNLYNTYTSGTFFLTRVTTRNHRVIDFGYVSKSMTYYDQVQSYKSYDQADPQSQCRTGSQLATNVLRIEISNKLLRSITWDDGVIDFYADSTRQDLLALDTSIKLPFLHRIKVTSQTGKVVKDVRFSYGYFSSNARLKLKEVRFIDPELSQIDNKYAFTYFGEEAAIPSLARPNNAQDLWGYYNGASAAQILPKLSLISDYYHRIQSTGYTSPDRGTNAVAKYGLLKDMIYPTGGKTRFEYEPNLMFYKELDDIPISMRDQVNLGATDTVLYDAYVSALSVANAYAEQNRRDTIILTEESRVSITKYIYNNDLTGFGNSEAWVDGLTCSQAITQLCNTYDQTSTGYTTTAEYILPPGSYSTFLLASAVDNHSSNARLVIKKFLTNTIRNFVVPVGGFRVAKRENYIMDSIVQFTKYLYPLDTSNTQFNGKLRIEPELVATTQRLITGTYPALCVTCQATYTVSSFDIKNKGGYLIEYPKVIELEDNDGVHGKTDHYFSLSETIGGGNFPFASAMNIDWIAGIEVRKDIYEKPLSPDSLRLLQSQTKGFTQEEDSSFGDYSLKVGVQNIEECLGYPNIIGTENAAAYALGSFSFEYVPNYTEKFNVAQENTLSRNYDQTNGYTQNNTFQLSTFLNSSNNLPAKISSLNSRGDTVSKRILYSLDYSMVNPVIADLRNAGYINAPIEQILVKKDSNGNEFVLGGSFISYHADRLTPEKLFVLDLPTPVAINSFVVSYIDGGGDFVKDSRYVETISFLKYDLNGNILEQQKSDGIKQYIIWDYNGLYPVAEITNADSTTVAFTSFESNSKGGWSYSGGTTSDVTSVTGNKCYTLNGGNNITRSGLPNLTYIISYWGKGGSVLVNGGGPVRTGNAINGWTYYEHELTTTAITIAGNKYIDELRMYPKRAKMISYTYEPLVGIKTVCDLDNRINYYEYDGMRRLALIRDQDRNVVRRICYNYFGQPEHCVVDTTTNWQSTGTTRCQPCPGNGAYLSNVQEHQEKDNNPYSPTYNSIRWISDGVSGNCVPAPGWETNSGLKCELDGNSENTGYQVYTQKDMNPCSATYNQERTITNGYNPAACPIPCNSSNCNGNNKKCINGVCETGTDIVIVSARERVLIDGVFVTKWVCLHKYCFSDGSLSTYSYSTYHDSACSVSACF